MISGFIFQNSTIHSFILSKVHIIYTIYILFTTFSLKNKVLSFSSISLVPQYFKNVYVCVSSV